MSQVDEGLIHAWLDGELSPDDAARVEQLVERDPAWRAAATEARGLVAGSSRILSSLDDVPSRHAPTNVAGAHISKPRRHLLLSAKFRAAALLVFAAGIGTYAVNEWQQRSVATIEAVQNAPAPAPPALREAPPVTAPPATALGESPARSSARRDALAPGRGAAPAGAGAGGTGGVASAPPAATAAGAAPPRETAQQDARAEKAEKTVAQSAANTQRSESIRAADSAGAVPKIVLAPVSPVPPSLQQQANVAAVRGGGGGRGGLPRNEIALGALAASNDLLNSCWQVDSVGTRQDGDTRTRESQDAQYLRFIQPVVTDMAVTPPVQRAALPLIAGSDQARARVTSVAFRKTDSTYVGEMVVPDGRIELEFTMHGDTLRGTSRRTGVTVRYAPQPWLAVRARCPQ